MWKVSSKAVSVQFSPVALDWDSDFQNETGARQSFVISAGVLHRIPLNRMDPTLVNEVDYISKGLPERQVEDSEVAHRLVHPFCSRYCSRYCSGSMVCCSSSLFSALARIILAPGPNTTSTNIPCVFPSLELSIFSHHTQHARPETLSTLRFYTFFTQQHFNTQYT